MYLLDVIKTRCSVRNFRPDAISESIIAEMLEAARYAPSGGNAQPHCFGVITDRDLKVKLAEAAGNQMWIADAPVVFACCADISWDVAKAPKDDFGLRVNKLRFGEEFIEYLNAYEDRNAVSTLLQNAAPLIPAEHMFLVASYHGLGGCFVGYLDVQNATEILKLPPHMACLFLLPVGYPAEECRHTDKKGVNEISFFNLYGKNHLPKLLANWDIEPPRNIQDAHVLLYRNKRPSVWIVDGRYVLKRFTNLEYMKRGTEMARALDEQGMPVAIPIKTKERLDCLERDREYYCLYPKLKGESLKDYFEGDFLNRASYVGRIIGRLHRAFRKCGSMVKCRESDLLEEVVRWAIPSAMYFSQKAGNPISREMLDDYTSAFPDLYRRLPRQIIHRDMHGENLLFEKGTFTGYVDFDMVRRDIRIFDLCYMAAGILSNAIGNSEKCDKWIGIFEKLLEGYGRIYTLGSKEKEALVYVIYSIQLMIIAYFGEKECFELVDRNVRTLNWIYENRHRLEF